MSQTRYLLKTVTYPQGEVRRREVSEDEAAAAIAAPPNPNVNRSIRTLQDTRLSARDFAKLFAAAMQCRAIR